MSWSESLFQKAWNWLASVGSEMPTEVTEKVHLSEVKSRLAHFASLLAETPIKIMASEAEGGFVGHTYFLPQAVSLYDSRELNMKFYLFRVAFLTAQRQLNLNWSDSDYHLEAAKIRAAQTAQVVLDTLTHQYPGMDSFLMELIPETIWDAPMEIQSHYWGYWMVETQEAKPLNHSPNAQPTPPTLPQTEAQAPVKEQVEVIEKDEQAVKEYTLQHYFEKVETLDAFHGAWRETDGDDELEAHREALEQVDLRQVMRSDDPTHSVYQAELMLNTAIPESREKKGEGFYVTYDEWNAKKKAYRPQFCRVYPQAFVQTAPDYYTQTLTENRSTLNQLRTRLAHFYNELETQRRQRDGERLDLDALVENYADRLAGLPPCERVYISRRKRKRDIAVLILMDLSLSTDGYTSGLRVIDVEKQAVLLFGELLSEYGDRFQVDGFSSRTRNHCDYIHLKTFDEHWGKGASRIGALEPRGYTRIGPALRHATTQMKACQARKKWILLLSDGKPNDYDRYEGQYGIQDVRQAIREAEQEQIHCFALAVESAAKHYLPPMLGEGRYQVLPRPQDLPTTLTQFYSRLIYSLA